MPGIMGWLRRLGPEISPVEEIPRVLAGLGPELATEKRGLDQLPATRALPRVQRRQDARQQVLAGDVVGDGGADRRWVGARSRRSC